MAAAIVALKRYLSETDLSKQEKSRLLVEIGRGHGDPGNGHAIYARICVACHKVGREGTEYGPDLTQVGTRLKRPQIVESILEPNAQIAKGYETTNLTAGDGHAFTGFITAETSTTLTVRLAPGVVQEVQKSDIKKRETIKQSSMPDGFGGTMASQEFLDLVEFLATQKGASAK